MNSIPQIITAKNVDDAYFEAAYVVNHCKKNDTWQFNFWLEKAANLARNYRNQRNIK